MACVLTVAVVDDGRATIGHVGDTRLYKLRGGRIEKVTRDHSPVGEREDANEISEAEAMRHPRRNEVYRDVGSEPHEPAMPDFVDVDEIAVRARRGAAALQRRADRPGRLGDDRAASSAARRAIRSGRGRGAHRRGQRRRAARTTSRRLRRRARNSRAPQRWPQSDAREASDTRPRRAGDADGAVALGALGDASRSSSLGGADRPSSPPALPSCRLRRRTARVVVQPDRVDSRRRSSAPGRGRRSSSSRASIASSSACAAASASSAACRGARRIRLPVSATEVDPAVVADRDHRRGARRVPDRRRCGDAAGRRACSRPTPRCRFIDVEITGRDAGGHRSRRRRPGVARRRATFTTIPAPACRFAPARRRASPTTRFARNGLSERAGRHRVIDAGAEPVFYRNVFQGMTSDAFVGRWSEATRRR